jgi:hypothetical protein
MTHVYQPHAGGFAYFTSGVINGAIGVGGTWTAYSTLTLPAYTLGGTVTSNGQSFSGTIANLGTVTTVDLNGGTIDGTIIGGAVPAAGTFTTAAATTGNITTVNATTVDATNIEVTNLKAKDGTAAGSIADATGVVTLASSVLTTTDINAGTIDGTTQASGTINGPIAAGGTWTAAAAWTLPAFTLGGTVTSNGQSFSGTIANLGTVTTADINGGTIDGTPIGGSSSSTGAFTTLAVGVSAAESGTMAHLRQAAGEYALFESFAQNANFSLRRANGTAGAPTALADTNLIGAFAWRGHDGSAYTFAKARIDAYANGAWSGSATGTDLAFLVTDPAGTTIAEKLRLTGDGRLYGKSLHNNSGPDTGTTNQFILSKTYTPTFTNTTNITSSTAYAESTCVRVGNVVIVGVLGTIRPAAAGGCTLGVSLPIASNFTNAAQLQGGGSYYGLADLLIYGDSTNDRAAIFFVAPADPGSEVTFSCTFIYTIL